MFLIYFAIHAILEAIYLGLCGPAYAAMVKSLLKDGSMPPYAILYAILAYAIFFLATYVIVFKDAAKKSLRESLTIGVLFGLAVYGVYNLTNMFLINKYDIFMAVRDMTYGAVSMVLLVLAARIHVISF